VAQGTLTRDRQSLGLAMARLTQGKRQVAQLVGLELAQALGRVAAELAAQLLKSFVFHPRGPGAIAP
jgi:hypothetical protein